MNSEEFKASIAEEQAPPAGLSIPLAALWWDAQGDWARAHSLVDELESVEGMAVHACLHRKEGSVSNADTGINVPATAFIGRYSMRNARR
jgi:hypothetical protein